MKKLIIAFLLCALLLSGCTDLISGATEPTPAPTATIAPLHSPTPVPSITPSVTATPLQTPTPSIAQEETPTPEPSPEPECEPGWKCDDSDNRAYQKADCSWGTPVECTNGCTNGLCDSLVSGEPVELDFGENIVFPGDLLIGLLGAGEFEGVEVSLEVMDFWSSTEVEFALFDSEGEEIGREVISKGEFVNEKFLDESNQQAIGSELELTDLRVNLATLEGKITLTLFD